MRQGRNEALASGLGWFSIALGLAELCIRFRVLGMDGKSGQAERSGAGEEQILGHVHDFYVGQKTALSNSIPGGGEVRTRRSILLGSMPTMDDS